LGLGACGGGDSPATASGTAILRGVVHVQPLGPAIGGARVSVQGRVATTAANGSFTLNDLAPGSAMVMLEAAGFRSATIQLALAVGDNFFSLAMEPL
jgi:hypothetical protein